MASRVGAVINLIKEIAALNPTQEKTIIRHLLILLKIRETKLVSDIAAKLKRTSSQMPVDPENRVVSAILAKEAEALNLFKFFTAEEVKTLENYLFSLVSKNPNSLASFLAKKLNAEIQDRYNLDNLQDARTKDFCVKSAFRNSDYHEDFQLSLKSPVTDQAILELIKEFYLGRGYQLEVSRIEGGIGAMFKSEKEVLFVTATPVANVVIVTVSVWD